MRKVLISLVILLALALGLVLALLQFQQPRLTQMALREADQYFSGTLRVGDSRLSLWADFPYVAVDLHDVAFFADKAATGRPIYELQDLYVGFRLWDLLRGDYDIHHLKIVGGHLDLVQSADGTLNLLRAKSVGTAADPADTTALALTLREVVIQDFDFNFTNEANGQRIAAHVAKTTTSIRQRRGHLFFTTDADSWLDVTDSLGNGFFRGKHLQLNTTLDYDPDAQRIALAPSRLALDDGVFQLGGTVTLHEHPDFDLHLRGDKSNFNLLAAFAPPEVADNLRRYESGGRIYFDGTICGPLGDSLLPRVDVRFGCENAFFLNPAVNRKLEELTFEGYFTTGDAAQLRTAELRLENVYARPEQGIFKGRFFVRDFTDPYIAINMHADVDLQFLAQFFGLQDLERLQGQILLDMDFDELVDVDKPEASLAQLKEGIDSELTIRNLSFRSPLYPHTIREVNGHAVMTQGRVRLDSLRFCIADSDFYLDGTLSDLPAIFHAQRQPIRMKLRTRASRIDVAQLLAHDSALASLTSEVLTDFRAAFRFETSVDNLLAANPIPRGKFVIEDCYGQLKHYAHTFHDFHAEVEVGAEDLHIRHFRGEIDQSDFRFAGQIKHYDLWLADHKRGDTELHFDASARQLVLRDLLTYQGVNYLPEDYQREEIRDLQLRGRVALHYDSTLHSTDFYLDGLSGRFRAHPLPLRQWRGRAHHENGLLTVENLAGQLGESDFLVNLRYHTDSAATATDDFLTLTARRLDLDALLDYDPGAPTDHATAFNVFELPFPNLRVEVRADQVRYHQVFLQDFWTKLRVQKNHYLYADTLALRTAGGALGMSGYFNGSDPAHIYFHTQIRARDLDLDQLLIKFDNFGQDYALHENLHGRLSGTVEGKWLLHPDLTPILEASTAHLEVAIHDGSLVNFAPMLALSDYFKDKNLHRVRFDTLQNTLDLRDGMLHIPTMNINTSLGFMELSGQQYLDLRMRYFVRIPWQMVTQVGARTLFGGKNKEEVDPDQVDAIMYRDQSKRVRFLNLRIEGTPDQFDVKLGRERGSVAAPTASVLAPVHALPDTSSGKQVGAVSEPF